MKMGNGLLAKGRQSQPPDILSRTFQFAVEIVKLSGQLEAHPGVGRVMMSQILRAGTSIPANVEEAQAAQSRADFISKMSIALKEARETHLRLRLLATANIVSGGETASLIRQADELRRIIGSIIVSARRKGGQTP
jgi:four helix bundle protein